MPMRLATLSRTLTLLAVSAMLAAGALAQANISPNAVRDQLNQSSAPQPAPSQPQPAPSQAEVKAPKKPAAPAASAPAKPVAASAAPVPKAPAPANAQAAPPAKSAPAATTKTPAAPPATTKKTDASAQPKAPASAKSKAPQKPAEASKEPTKEGAKEGAKLVKASAPAPAAEKGPEEKPVARRDPFDTLLTKARAGNAPPENLPPGKAGLVVETLRIDGIVRSPNGMIAIVSNAQQRVYFLRDGDKLYDGSVEKIALDSIAFHEVGKDAFGKPLERTVTKQLLSASSGEQR